MGRGSDDEVIRELLYHYLSDAQAREKDADKRHADLVRAHRDGWKLVADALSGGLRGIADAIRSR